jgi:hypothetical protein
LIGEGLKKPSLNMRDKAGDKMLDILVACDAFC